MFSFYYIETWKKFDAIGFANKEFLFLKSWNTFKKANGICARHEGKLFESIDTNVTKEVITHAGAIVGKAIFQFKISPHNHFNIHLCLLIGHQC